MPNLFEIDRGIPTDRDLTADEEHQLFGDIEDDPEHRYGNLHARTAEKLETNDAAGFFNESYGVTV